MKHTVNPLMDIIFKLCVLLMVSTVGVYVYSGCSEIMIDEGMPEYSRMAFGLAYLIGLLYTLVRIIAWCIGDFNIKRLRLKFKGESEKQDNSN